MALALLRPEQARSVSQVPRPPVPQQGWPSPPQVAQTLPEAASVHCCGAVHAVTPLSAAPGPAPVGQQSWSGPPQAPHVPGVLVAVARPEQTNPLLQVPLLPVPQHDCAEPPQVVQMLPEALSTQDPEVHWVTPPPVQQGCPSAPHAPQVPGVPDEAVRPEQARPVLQVPVLPVPQQDCPEPPQVPHTLPLAESRHERSLSHDPPPPNRPGSTTGRRRRTPCTCRRRRRCPR